jgi:hypothetical protein
MRMSGKTDPRGDGFGNISSGKTGDGKNTKYHHQVFFAHLPFL